MTRPPRKFAIPEPLRFAASGNVRDLLRLSLASLAVGALSLTLPWLCVGIFDDIIPQGRTSGLVPMGAALAGAAIVGGLLRLSARRAGLRMEIRSGERAASAAWKHLLDLPLSDLLKSPAESGSAAHAAGEMVKKITESGSLILPASAIVLTNFGFMAVRDPVFALGAGVMAGGATGLAFVLSTFRKEVRHREFENRSRLLGRTHAWVRGISKIRLAGAEAEIFAQWQQGFTNLLRAGQKADGGKIAVNALLAGYLAVSSAGLFAMAAPSGIPVGEFLALFSAFGAFIVSVFGLMDLYGPGTRIATLAKAALPLLKTPPESLGKTADPGLLTGAITVQNLVFRYQNHTPVLDGVSLNIQAGEFVALTGQSGSGKSSLLRLILGLTSPSAGTIFLDGHDLATLNPALFRAQIGIVLQNPVIFAGDLYQNISGETGRPLAEVWEAAELAGIAGEIRRLPMQMHTMVSEGGANFSFGQRQRLALARVLAGRPQILLLDEATSALDSPTQTLVLDALQTLKNTRLMVAHRLSALSRADRILVLKDGRIVESGTCRELLDRGGEFFRLMERQIP